MISDNEETVLDDSTLKRRLALSLFTGIWMLLSLFFIDFVLSLTLEPHYLYFISAGGGLVAPQTLLGIWDPMMQVVVPVTMVAFVLELTIEYMRRNTLQSSFSNGYGELFRAAVVSCLVIIVNDATRLFRYLPFGSTVLTFLAMLLFYRLSSRLGYKKKASYIRNWIREEWTSSIKMVGAARNTLSPVILSAILFEFIMWFPNWEKRLYFSTSSHMSVVLWSIPMILYIVIYYNSIGLLINKVIIWLKPNNWTGRWVCMGVSVVGLLEIGKFYVVDSFTYFALIVGLVTSWFISEFINRRQLRILGPALISRTLGLKAVGKARFSRNRANITVLTMGIILLSGFAVVPREVIAFQSIELSPVRVAVIDLGVNSDDPWLRHNIVSSKSFVTVENGFKQSEESPQPLSPEMIHGTFVAHCITEVFPAVSIVSAKVGNSSGFITKDAIYAAVQWCIEEGNVSVINLSIGAALYDINDPQMEDLFEVAWKSGILIVVAAGNQQPYDVDGIYSTLIDIANSPFVLTVGAVDDWGQPIWHSSWGPNFMRLMKPDLVAYGYFEGIPGTSFAAPRAAGAAALIIDKLNRNGCSWSPGMLKAALMAGATRLRIPDYQVGAGRLNATKSIEMVISAPLTPSGIPKVMSLLPRSIPFDFEFLFGGVNYSIPLGVYCSDIMTPELTTSPSLENMTSFSYSSIHEFGIIELTLRLKNTSIDVYHSGHINVTWDGLRSTIDLSFVSRPTRAKLAMLTCYDTRNYYSSMGLYSRYYKMLSMQGIAVTEIRNRSLITTSFLQQFDGAVILDPFVSHFERNTPIPTSEEIDTFRDFADSGRGLLVAVEEANATYFNHMFQWTGLTLLNEVEYLFGYSVASHDIVAGLEDDIGELWNIEPRLFNTTSTGWQPLIYSSNLEQIIYEVNSFYNVTLCTEFPGRMLFHGSSIWFRNDYLGDGWHDASDLVDRMTKWILGLL